MSDDEIDTEEGAVVNDEAEVEESTKRPRKRQPKAKAKANAKHKAAAREKKGKGHAETKAKGKSADKKAGKDAKKHAERKKNDAPEHDAAALAKKARISRKSAAYHAAFKAAQSEGKPVEECRKMAKSVACPIFNLTCANIVQFAWMSC